MRLNISKIKDKTRRLISTEESLLDVVPVEWSEEVLNGEKLVEVKEVEGMKKDWFSCPITLGEYERVLKNEQVYNQLNEKQVDWLNEFFNNSKYNMRNIVLQLKEGVLWVLINTKNSIREFERM